VEFHSWEKIASSVVLHNNNTSDISRSRWQFFSNEITKTNLIIWIVFNWNENIFAICSWLMFYDRIDLAIAYKNLRYLGSRVE
jgi:hypothetical protein